MENEFKLPEGEKRSSLTIQEVYDKMQYMFYEGLKCGRQETNEK